MTDEVFPLIFDGADVDSEERFHQEVRFQSGIDWYGCNLDALDDMLCSIIPMAHGPFRVEWRNADLGSWQWRQRFIMIVGIMKEMQERFPDRFVEFKMTFAEPYFGEGQDPFPRR